MTQGLDATPWSLDRQPLFPPQLPLSSVSSFCAGCTAAKAREPMETQVVATSADELWRREPVSELYVHFLRREDCILSLAKIRSPWILPLVPEGLFFHV